MIYTDPITGERRINPSVDMLIHTRCDCREIGVTIRNGVSDDAACPTMVNAVPLHLTNNNGRL